MQTTRRPSPAWLGLIVLLGITLGLSADLGPVFPGRISLGDRGESRRATAWTGSS